MNAPHLHNLPYGRQLISEEDVAAVAEALRSELLTTGPRAARFERQMADMVGARHAIVVCNATAALHLAMRVAGVGPGDRTVTSPNTFAASANCAAFVGATPDFSDIDPVSYNLDPVVLAAGWKPDTKAVVAVDYAGQPANLPEIARVARAHGAVVIEDACHAVGGAFWQEGREWKVGRHPWADMVRLARSGGEGNAVAIRIARAATGKDKIAICGYHGCHDWYLSANLGDDKNLAGHLLPGLEPNGVPQNLRGTVFPFNYNNFAELEALVNAHDIGVIKMEVVRNKGPEDNFLQKVRKLATDRGIVLIFDECISGFRQTFGGLHKMYGVDPDMPMFSKAMGNGYAITAVIGRRKIMEAAQTTFISSTFWTERIGPTAALKTLEVMGRPKSWDTITQTGLIIRRGWQQLADNHGLKIEHWGLPALTGFTFQSSNALAYKTLITEEMLDKGYLAGNSVYVCIEHTPEVVADFFGALDPVFELIKECEEGRDVMKLLKGPVCHSGFNRLN
jgi:glutamate-1-semialdehyde aminotransferase